jgi:hypothetical protein
VLGLAVERLLQHVRVTREQMVPSDAHRVARAVVHFSDASRPVLAMEGVLRLIAGTDRRAPSERNP